MKQVIEASQGPPIAAGTMLCKPDVIPMYSITPQTHVVKHLAEFINNGELRCEMLDVESEYSAASAVIGAVAAGSRAKKPA